MFLLLASLAQAATLAVLPLEQGAGSEEYAGLGRPLAGMLTADLAQAPDLSLVERQQLDALLAEIELGSSGYLDPSTAQQAGRGLGADHVVVGSYSVVEGQFLLEARMVRVDSGEVVQAGHASGPVADFVAVEKELVDALLEELEVELSSGARRKIIVQTPTEAFEAFAAYGAGLAQEQAGQREQAEQSFSQALLVDPDFDEARAALVQLRSGLEQREQARLDAAVDAWHQARLDVLEAVPSETTRAADFRHDPESLAQLGLRLTALKQLDRDCERYDELFAYARREGVPPKTTAKADEALIARSQELWVQYGLVDSAVKAERSVWRSSPSLWREPLNYLFDAYGWLADGRIVEGDGMLGALHACFPPEERGARVAELRALLLEQGLAELPFGRDGATLDQAMRFHEAWARAGGGGLDAGLQKELEGLLAELSGDPKLAKWGDQQLRKVVQAAEGWAWREATLLGLEEEVLWGITRAYAEGGGGLVKTEGATCQEMLRQKQVQAEFRLEQLAEGEQDPDWILQQLWVIVVAPRDLGCLEGIPARFANAEEVYAWGHSAPSRARADRPAHCDAAMADLAESLDIEQVRRNAGNPTINAMQASVALEGYTRNLVLPGCVTE